jgi:RNA-dependent RNA polymerase
MFASNSLVSADGIRRWMGDFLRIRNVAKCAARMGQSFSSSTKSVDVERWETEEIPEIRNEGCPYPFSDGIGKISESFAVRVAKKCRLVKQYGVPSSYQIRYGGYKGVVAVDPTMESSSYKLSLRPSMNKFPSEQISLDILNWSRPMPSYLNREIITLLSTLGIADSVFEGMQARVLVKLEAMMEDAELAMEVLETFAGGQQQQVLLKMLSCGFRADREPFLRSMLHAFRACQLSQLRRKAHIFVPKGRLLMGCLDETRTLDYGQVFICVSPSRSPLLHHRSSFDDGLETRVVCRGIGGSTRAVKIVRGKVIVAKNPCCHPGDIRILSAVDVPSLHHLVDCVVFPQRGPR